jgi:hypothetical protein
VAAVAADAVILRDSAAAAEAVCLCNTAAAEAVLLSNAAAADAVCICDAVAAAAEAVSLCCRTPLIVISTLSILLFIVLILGKLGEMAVPCFMVLTFIILVSAVLKLVRLDCKSPITSEPLYTGVCESLTRF